MFVVKARNSQKPHMPELFVAFTSRDILSVCFQASQCLCCLLSRKQSVPIRCREFLFPSMALLVDDHKGVGHFALLWGGRFQATTFTCGISVTESSAKTKGSFIGA